MRTHLIADQQWYTIPLNWFSWLFILTYLRWFMFKFIIVDSIPRVMVDLWNFAKKIPLRVSFCQLEGPFLDILHGFKNTARARPWQQSPVVVSWDDSVEFQNNHQILLTKMVNNMITGWWFQPLWKMMEFVSWDDDIPNIWKRFFKYCSKPNMSWPTLVSDSDLKSMTIAQSWQPIFYTSTTAL
jgi:hypothetical protein